MHTLRHYLYSNGNTGKHLFVRVPPGGRAEWVRIQDQPGQEDTTLNYHNLVRAMVELPAPTEGLRNWLNLPFKSKSAQKRMHEKRQNRMGLFTRAVYRLLRDCES